MNLYKNLKMKVYLGLILVLASIPVHASLETWALKNDLIIPSLETPSISVLDSKAKQEIMMGFECCWAQKHIEAVKREHSLKSIESLLKENPRRSQFIPPSLIEPVTNVQWATFLTFQLADIYTTYRGLKYNCVREMNPIAGERPSVPEMFLLKSVILSPAIKAELQEKNLDNYTMDNINLVMSVVIYNNYHVWHKAERNCN